MEMEFLIGCVNKTFQRGFWLLLLLLGKHLLAPPNPIT
jgi:hypothetical protein